MEHRRTIALFKRPKKEEQKKLGIWRLVFSIRTFEIIGVIGVFAALTVYGYEFLVEKPRDRAVAIASLYSQIAQTHALPDEEGYPAISRSVETLVQEGVPLTGMDLSGVYFERVNLDGADFTNANLENAVFIAVSLTGASFQKTNLKGANFDQVNLAYARFYSTNLETAKIYNSLLNEVSFSSANLRKAELNLIYTNRIYFNWGNNVTGAYLSVADKSADGWVGVGNLPEQTTALYNKWGAAAAQYWGQPVLSPEMLDLINIPGLCKDKGAEVPKFLPKGTYLENCN